MIQISIVEFKDDSKNEKILLYLKNQIIIANYENSDLFLEIDAEKSIIAEILYRNDKLFFLSRSSKIDIKVNDREIKPQEIFELLPDDIILIGNYTLRVSISEETAIEKMPKDEVEQTKLDDEPPSFPYISTMLDNEELSRFAFSNNVQEIYVGRDIDNDIIINKPSISRKHAKIKKDGENYTIYDLESKNGIFINNNKIDDNYTLNDGDIIRLGQSQEPNPIYLIFHNPHLIKETNQFQDESQEISPSLAKDSYLKSDTSYAVGHQVATANRFITALLLMVIVIILTLIVYFLVLPHFNNSPEIFSISPNIINYNEEFFINGDKFLYKKVPPKIIIDDYIITPSEFSSTRLRAHFPRHFIRPAGIHSFNVSVRAFNKDSNKYRLKVKFLPVITELSTKKTYPGNKITIYGYNFDPNSQNISIILPTSSIKPESSTLNSISFRLEIQPPDKDTLFSLVAEVNGIRSNSQMILILARKLGNYSLAFQIEKELSNNSEIYTIKTDFAKLFTFTNAGTYSNIKERAYKAIDKLNEMVAMIKNYRVDIATKETSQNASVIYNAMKYPSIVRSATLFDINNDDAVYYSQLKQSTVRPLDLASWISLVLNDYIGLFAFYEYPINTADISNGGKALKYIWYNFANKDNSIKIPYNFYELIPQEYKTSLANFIEELPKAHSNISGNWLAKGDDLFLKTENSFLYMHLNIKEEDNIISGSAIINVSAKFDEVNTFNYPLGSFNIKANFKDKKNKNFSFSLDIPKYGLVSFEAMLIASSLFGSYEIKKQNNRGYWYAVYQPK